MRISLGQFQIGKCLHETVMDWSSQEILVETVLVYLKLSPSQHKILFKPQTPKTHQKAWPIEILQGFDTLWTFGGWNNDKYYSKLYSNDSRLPLKQIKQICETLGEDSQDFWRGFVRICKTLGEDSWGFTEICKTLGEDSKGFTEIHKDSWGFAGICKDSQDFGIGFMRL